jgi:hypothetical protein
MVPRVCLGLVSVSLASVMFFMAEAHLNRSWPIPKTSDGLYLKDPGFSGLAKPEKPLYGKHLIDV